MLGEVLGLARRLHLKSQTVWQSYLLLQCVESTVEHNESKATVEDVSIDIVQTTAVVLFLSL